jgi:hypothetical protein
MSIGLAGLEGLCLNTHFKLSDVGLGFSDMLLSLGQMISELLIENVKAVDLLHKDYSL